MNARNGIMQIVLTRLYMMNRKVDYANHVVNVSTHVT